jgi:GH35 family endo-1,4-beta-xylanase
LKYPLAVGFKKPHLPFVAPKKYWDLYDANEIRLAQHQAGIENASGYSIHDSHEFRGYEGVPKEGLIPAELQRKSIHGYLACVSYIDAQVGLLLKELDDLGIADNTIVVLWGDHGFHLGDHGMWGKHTTLENATRVPLIIRTLEANKVAQTNSPVELNDIYPTLADLAGIEIPTAINGRSLVPLLSKESKPVRAGALTIFKSRGSLGYSFRTERYRYTEWINKAGKCPAKELYDYESDPLEKINLADQKSHSEIQNQLAKQLRAHAQGCERLKPSEPESTPNPQPTSLNQSDDPIRASSNIKSDAPVLIGAASNAKFWDTSSYEIVNREFAYVTPGNDFKQTAIHPQPGKWKWKTADEWIERCKKNSQVMRLHSAISPQCSKWAKSDNRTPAELKQNLQEYMTEVCKRYNDQPHVRWMDVVNETVSRNGEWFGPREGNDRWENPWYQIGVDERHPLKPPVYIKMAFELANQHAPNIKQIVNQHGGMETAMWDKVKGIVEHLQDSGIRVDGIGWQGHIDTGFENDPNNMKALKSLIEWAQSRKLEFHVTEFNAWIRTEEGETISKDDLAAQAKTYLAVLEVLRDYGDTGVVTWCAWQIKDNETERGHLQGNLYDAEGQPKPALKAVKRFSQKSVAQKSANQN